MAGELVERLRDQNYAGQMQHLRSWSEIDELFAFAADRIEALERENAALRAERDDARKRTIAEAAAICDGQAKYFLELSNNPKCLNDLRWDSREEAQFTMQAYAERHESDAAAIRNMGGGDKTKDRDNLSEQPHGDGYDSAFHPADRAAKEPATDGDRSFEGAGQASRTGGRSRPLLGERARTDGQSGDPGFGYPLTAGCDALEERGDGG